MTTRIDTLTDEQKARMPEWAAKWIAVGQCTDEADWARFEAAAEKCYGYANLPWHNNVVRVSNPLVLSLAAPIAAVLIERQLGRPPRGAVDGAVDDAVDGAVFMAHDEHGFMGFGPGTYRVGRQREQADEIREVAD